jgi:hypothetical protein
MTDDPWAGIMDTAAAPAGNPFDPNDHPDLHTVWNNRIADEDAEAARIHQQQILHRATSEALLRLRARRAAEDELRAELAQTIAVPAPTDLHDLLAEPDNPTAYRIDGLWPAGGNVVLAAAYKAGKTTATGNLLRSLADGEPFLDLWQVAPVMDGRIGVIDLEMPRDRFKAWLRDQGITHPQRITTWALRGQATTFDIVNPAVRDMWVQRLVERAVRVLVVDCLGPILSALGRDEDNKGVGPILDALAALGHEAGITEMLLVHHMGHVAERARGASRLRDWPDAEWRIVRQRDPDNPAAEPAPNAPRFFAAFGRDVEVGEGQLSYDAKTRHLTYAQGSRREARSREAQLAVLEFVASQPGKSGRAIEAALISDGTITQAAVREALAAAAATGLFTIVIGPHRAKLHHLSKTGKARLRSLIGEKPADDKWPEEIEPDNVDRAPLVQCPSCFTGHTGPRGTLCTKCEEAN